jgi:hypothetical protein
MRRGEGYAMTTLLTPTEDRTSIPMPSASMTTESAEVSPHRSPRSSALATLSLLFSVPGAVVVASGVLAAAGAALGLVGTLFAIGGLVATRHRHIVGRGNAIVGILLGILAVAAGVLMVTGVVPGLDAQTNLIDRLVEWLDANATWARPTF